MLCHLMPSYMLLNAFFQLMEEKQRQHYEEQENIDELKRYREETAEENKVL